MVIEGIRSRGGGDPARLAQPSDQMGVGSRLTGSMLTTEMLKILRDSRRGYAAASAAKIASISGSE